MVMIFCTTVAAVCVGWQLWLQLASKHLARSRFARLRLATPHTYWKKQIEKRPCRSDPPGFAT